jgi:hypothetical protein
MPEMTKSCSLDVKLYSSQSEKNYRRGTHLIVLIYILFSTFTRIIVAMWKKIFSKLFPVQARKI